MDASVLNIAGRVAGLGAWPAHRRRLRADRGCRRVLVLAMNGAYQLFAPALANPINPDQAGRCRDHENCHDQYRQGVHERRTSQNGFGRQAVGVVRVDQESRPEHAQQHGSGCLGLPRRRQADHAARAESTQRSRPAHPTRCRDAAERASIADAARSARRPRSTATAEQRVALNRARPGVLAAALPSLGDVPILFL